MSQSEQTTSDLLNYIHQSPTPFHCVAETVRRLNEAGFTRLEEGDSWNLQEGDSCYVVRDGALVAFRLGSQPAAKAGFRLLGAHTDSPNLRIKPLPDQSEKGYHQLGVEVYGGLLTYTWLDRDLGLAGKVVHSGDDGPSSITSDLVWIDRPLLRVPSLAIHLNRDYRTEGLKLNNQTHMAPILGLSPEEDEKKSDTSVLKALLGKELNLDPDKVLSWDLSLVDVTAPALGGLNNEFIFSPRLDNQAMCHAALTALIRTREATSATAPSTTSVVGLYDHEEVGSGSTSGAGGSITEDLLYRIAEIEGPGATAGGFTRAVAHSLQISADMAHAIHPNYVDRHEPKHLPKLNAGPVIKINTQQRYATCSEGAALFEAWCKELEVPHQKFVTRTDLACGSTIGPISAARTGIRTVDVGNPMLSMHSIREQAGAEDPERMVQVMTRFLQG